MSKLPPPEGRDQDTTDENPHMGSLFGSAASDTLIFILTGHSPIRGAFSCWSDTVADSTTFSVVDASSVSLTRA